MIGVKLEVSGINEIINVLGRYEAELPACISRAINRSLEMTKTEQIRKTMEIYYVKKNKLSSTINVFKSTKSSLKGEITSGGRPIGMDHFLLNPKTRAKSGRKMVTGAIKRDGIKNLPNAFIAYYSGKLGAFKRVDGFKEIKGKRKIIKRQKIDRLRGPSAPQMLGNLSILKYLQGYADEKFRMRLDHEIDRVIGL
jgi:hypothetical protein